MKQSGKVILVLAGCVLVASASKIVWLPDIWFAPHRVLASMSLKDGSNIKVVEFWNRCDFYTVELQHITMAGETNSVVIDPDSPKVWFCKLRADDKGRVAISFDARSMGKYDWHARELFLRNGGKIQAQARSSFGPGFAP